MADSVALRELKEVVNKTLWKSKRPSSEFLRFYEFAIDGYRDLRLNHANEGYKIEKKTPSTYS